MILIIDNYDSFVYNLAQLFGMADRDVKVVRNDKITISEICDIQPSHIVISPGPGRPESAGMSCGIIRRFYQTCPILGVCLGHQCIGSVFNARVGPAQTLVHGKTSMIFHNGQDIFQGIENPFSATRYHSLIVEKKGLPSSLVINAWTEDGVIMGIRHKDYPVYGVQFHPESVLTECGMKLIENFLRG